MSGRVSFRWLWTGQTASVFGTAISALAIPTIAIVALRATPFEVGALEAVQFGAFPILGLAAGVWVDRWSRRTTMLVADVVRAVALGSIPLAAAFGHVSYLQLIAVAACVGICSVFFDVAYQALVPSLVEHDALEAANARLEVSNSAAQVAGSGLAGGLIAAIGAPLAVIVDAASYAVSVVTLAVVRVRETHRLDGGASRAPFATSVREGLAVVFGSPVLVRIAGATATSNFGGAIGTAVYLLYAYRVLHLSPAVVGALFAVANFGFAGAFFAPRIARRFGVGPTLVWSLSVAAFAQFLIPLALVGSPLLLLFLAQLAQTAATPVYNITQVSLRQRLVPTVQLGRMSATMKTIVWGTLPLGMLVGGVLGGTIGIVPTLVISAVIGASSVPWLLGTPIAALHAERTVAA